MWPKRLLSYQRYENVFYLSLRSKFRAMMSLTISALKRFSIRLYIQLLVEGRMSYLPYLYLSA